MLQTGFYLSLLGPTFVRVRFRCPRCRRVGEHLVQEEAWDPRVLGPADRDPETLRRWEEMGPITPEEVIDFHFALDRLVDE